MAVSDRYKLIFSSRDAPWMFDLQRDPDEVINVASQPAYRTILQEMAGKLVDYDQKFDDPFMDSPKLKKDIEQAH